MLWPRGQGHYEAVPLSMPDPSRTISILGSTGSIGTQTLDILSRLGEGYSVRWLTCNTKWEDLAGQVRAVAPYGVAIREKEAWQAFKDNVDFNGPVLQGEEGLVEAASDSENDVVMSAMVGFSGVIPTLAAIKAGHIIGLANKETLVSAGQIIMDAVSRNPSATLIAVDSEHSAILQCIVGERVQDIEKFIITASGGPFRETPAMNYKA